MLNVLLVLFILTLIFLFQLRGHKIERMEEEIQRLREVNENLRRMKEKTCNEPSQPKALNDIEMYKQMKR